MTTSNQTPTQNFPTTPLARLTTPTKSPIHALTYSGGTGQYLLTGSQDRQIRLFNPLSGNLIKTFSGHGYEVLDLDVTENNEKFVSAGGDKGVFLWDVAEGVVVRKFWGHAGRVEGVRFGGEGEGVVVSGGFDGRVKVWDLRSQGGKAVQTFEGARDSVVSVEVLRGEIFAASVDGRVRVYDLRNGVVETDVVCPGKGCTSVMPARDGGGYVVSSLDSRVRFMDRGTGRCLQSFGEEGGFRNEVYRVRSCFAMGDGVVVSGSEDGRVFVWDVLSGGVVHKLWHKEGGAGGEEGKRDVVSAVAWNPVRKQWASAGGDGTVVVWGGVD